LNLNISSVKATAAVFAQREGTARFFVTSSSPTVSLIRRVNVAA